MFRKKLDFANYTLNFGSELVLLDLFEEIVMPSFFGKSGTVYSFKQQKMLNDLLSCLSWSVFLSHDIYPRLRVEFRAFDSKM